MPNHLTSLRIKVLNIMDKHLIPHKDNISEELSLFFDDAKYKKHFEKILGPMIYNSHINSNLICCAFCSSLRKSACHEFCFKCAKGVYEECSPILPGTFSFGSSVTDSTGEEVMPWIFKTPCTGFERIVSTKYFRNFTSFDKSIAIANIEVLEGLFTGASRGKKPCHICASVNIDIYRECTEMGKENFTCSKVSEFITEKYQVISGMIKCIE